MDMNDFVKLKKTIEKRKIQYWLDENVEYPSQCTINKDLTIDAFGFIYLRSRNNIEELPDYINFNEAGSFGIGRNFNFKSTRGFPKKAKRILCNQSSNKLYRPEGFEGEFQNHQGDEIHPDGTVTDGTYEEYLKWKKKNES